VPLSFRSILFKKFQSVSMRSMSQQKDDARALRITLPELFLAFSTIALSSFGGGVPALLHRAFVEHRGTVSESEFDSAFALARLMPGANVVNLAVLIGYRARGARGAMAAALGLLIGPTVLSIGMVVLYDHAIGIASVAAALRGAAAGAAGLLLAMGLQSTKRLLRRAGKDKRTQAGVPLALVTAATVFVLVAVFKIPTVWTVLCFVPISIAFAYATGRSSAKGSRSGHE
jgi:chromate transporter